MVESIGEHSQRKNLHTLNSFLARLPVGKNAGKVRYFRDPAAIFFLLDLDRYWHNSLLVPQPRNDLPGILLQFDFLNQRHPHLLCLRFEYLAEQIGLGLVALQVGVALSTGVFQLECLEKVTVLQQEAEFSFAVLGGGDGFAQPVAGERPAIHCE